MCATASAREVVGRAAETAGDEEEVDGAASRRISSAIVSISSGTAAIRRVSTPSGASRFASHDAFVFGTSPETSSLPIVRIEAVAIYTGSPSAVHAHGSATSS